MSTFVGPDGRLYRIDPIKKQTVLVVPTPAPQPTSPAPQPTSPAPQPTSPATPRSSLRRTYTPGSITQPTSPAPQPTSPAPQPTTPAPQPTTPARTGTITLDPTPTPTQDGLRFTGVSDPGIQRVPGETQTQFQERQRLKTEFDAKTTAQRLAQERPGTKIEVQLGFTPTTGGGFSRVQPSISPQTISTRAPLRTEPEFLVQLKPRTPTTSNVLRSSALIASETPRASDFQVAQTLRVPGTSRSVQVGGLEPSITGRGLTTSAAFGIERVAARLQDRTPSTRVAISSAEGAKDILGFSRAEKVAEAGKTFVSIKAPGVSDDVVFSRGFETTARIGFGAVSETFKDPLRSTAIAGAGIGAGLVVGGVTGAALGAVSPGTAATITKFGSSVLTGAAVLGLGVVTVDVLSSPDRERRASQLVSESALLTPGVSSFRKTMSVVKTKLRTTKFETTRLKNLKTYSFVMPTGVKGQTTLTGSFIDDASLRATGLVFESPLGLPRGVTSRTPGLFPKGTIVKTDIPGFVTTTRTEAGAQVGLQRYGTRELGFERTRVYALDVKTGAGLELSPREFSSLIAREPTRFKILAAEDPFFVRTPRFGAPAPSVQTKLSFDITTGEIGSAIPTKKTEIKSFSFFLRDKRGQARIPSLDFDRIIDTTTRVGSRVSAVAKEPFSSIVRPVRQVVKPDLGVSRTLPSVAREPAVSSLSTPGTRSFFVVPSPLLATKTSTVARVDTDVFQEARTRRDTDTRTRSVVAFGFAQRREVIVDVDVATATIPVTDIISQTRSATRTDQVSRGISRTITAPITSVSPVTQTITRPTPIRPTTTSRVVPFIPFGVSTPSLSLGGGRRPSFDFDTRRFAPALKTASPGRAFLTEGVRTIKVGRELEPRRRRRRGLFESFEV